MGRLLFGLLNAGRAAPKPFLYAAERLTRSRELWRCSDLELSNLVQALGTYLLVFKNEVPFSARGVTNAARRGRLGTKGEVGEGLDVCLQHILKRFVRLMMDDWSSFVRRNPSAA